MLVRFSQHLRDLLSDWRRHSAATLVKHTPVSVILASMGVTALVLGLRQVGVAEPMELWAYDQLLRSRPQEAPDRRILVVGITEDDIQRYRFPIPDGILANAVAKLQEYQPRVIGLDIYRDLPVEPGHEQFVELLGKSDRLVAICKLSDIDDPGVAPPANVPSEQLSFSDLVVDPDGVVRRALLFAAQDRGKCLTPFSFSFQLARHYLIKNGIEPKNSQLRGYLELGSTLFQPLAPNSGSYQGIDARGYQILLNYRSGNALAQQVTLTQVLNNQINPEWVRDRIVLIGTTAPSAKDTFNTPYSAAQLEQPRMPGVVIHAQAISQILSAVLDGRPLLWYWPQWGEILWVWGWSFVGGLGAMRLRHPLRLGLATTVALVGLTGICYGLLTSGGWIPLVPPALALVATGAIVVVTIAYQMQQQQEQVAHLAKEQEQTIALLTTMFKEGTTKKLNTIKIENRGEQKTEKMKTAQTEPMSSSFDSLIHPSLDSSTDSSSLPILTPSLDSRYQIIRSLGQGGFGHTFLAEDTKRPGRPTCVVKYLMPARRDAKFLTVARRLFETEAKILEALGRHNQIPQLLAYFEENEEFYLIEEYIEGYPLNDELRADKRLSEVQVVDMLKSVLEVLAFIHKHDVIHRDIKPSNIIKSKLDGLFVLIDFGAVKQMQTPTNEEMDSESQTVAIGTRGYAPPEQFAGHPRPNSDIYALGMIAIQGVTGIFPHQLPQDPETGNVIWRPLANVSEELGKILDKMVQYHFSDRYQSAAAVLNDLNHLDRSKLSTEASDLRKLADNSDPDSLHLSDPLDSTTLKEPD